MTLISQRLWTVEEYYRMADAGILDPDERVELLEGKIIVMASKKPLYSLVNQLAADYLRKILGERGVIRIQEPVHLNDRSEPEPDIAIVAHPLRQYFDHHPTKNEIFLLIEIADATLKFDTERKAKIYAQAGIIEYWVVDVRQEQVYIFREAIDDKYTQQDILGSSDIVRTLAFLDVEVELSQFFPDRDLAHSKFV